AARSLNFGRVSRKPSTPRCTRSAATPRRTSVRTTMRMTETAGGIFRRASEATIWLAARETTRATANGTNTSAVARRKNASPAKATRTSSAPPIPPRSGRALISIEGGDLESRGVTFDPGTGLGRGRLRLLEFLLVGELEVQGLVVLGLHFNLLSHGLVAVVPRLEGVLAGRHLELELAVGAGHRVERVVEDVDPRHHPRMDVAEQADDLLGGEGLGALLAALRLGEAELAVG